MSMYVGLCTCIQVCPDTREGTRVSEPRVIGGCESYDMDVGAELRSSGNIHELLTTESVLQPPQYNSINI